MNNEEKSISIVLIRQAKEIELLDSNLAISCVRCKAIFPKDYEKCPQCNANQKWSNFEGLYNNNLQIWGLVAF